MFWQGQTVLMQDRWRIANETEGLRVEFSFVDISGSRYCHDREPEECPICHRAIHPDEHTWAVASAGDDLHGVLEIVHQCPRRECRHFFISRYARDDTPEPSQFVDVPGLRYFRLFECVPATPLSPLIPAEVAELAPSFVEIYSQARAAEIHSLPQVAGVGYRKALEFLIKDYCISTRAAEEKLIRSASLSSCVREYIKSPQARICATRAAWLGNDETHYERRWSDMDIDNLKELIVLTVNWIHSELLTRKYEGAMPE